MYGIAQYGRWRNGLRERRGEIFGPGAGRPNDTEVIDSFILAIGNLRVPDGTFCAGRES